jgi:hypothetical protein
VWTSGNYCAKYNSYDCFFLPITNCSVRRGSDVVTSEDYYRWTRRYPNWARGLLEGTVVDPEAFCWYWKTAVVQYLCRLAPRTESAIREVIRHEGFPFADLAAASFDVSIHIRGGDKKSETQRADTKCYIASVDLIRRLLGRRVSVFLCTDVPSALEEFRRAKGIDLYFVNIPWRPHNSFLTLKPFGDRAGLMTVADIFLATKSRYFIGEWASNVDRLIVELRSTVMALASNPFLEQGKADCISTAHCEMLGRKFNYWYKGEWISLSGKAFKRPR